MKQIQKHQQGNYFLLLNQRLNKTITDSQKKMSKYPLKKESQKKEIKVSFGVPLEGKLAIKQKVDTTPGRKLIHEEATKLRDGIASVFDFINPSKLAYLDYGQTSPFAHSDFNWKEVRKGQLQAKEAADEFQGNFVPSEYVRKFIPKKWQEDNPYMDLGLMAFDLWAGPKAIKGATKAVKGATRVVKDWRPWVPYDKNRYYRRVDKIGDPIGDANRTGVIRGPGSDPQLLTSVMNAYDETGRHPFNKHYTHLIEYPMFSKGKPWHGFWAFLDRDRIIIRSKKNTGPIIWEQSGKDFNYNNYNNIYRPNWYGDVNAAPTLYFEYWEPKRFGYMRRNFQ